MKIIKNFFFFILFLVIVQNFCYSIDPSIYEGKWKTKKCSVDIEIKIGDSGNVSVKLNNKALKNLEVSFVYGKHAILPFLFIRSSEKKIDHAIYLTIGSEKSSKVDDEYNTLRGFYVLSEEIDDHYGELKETYYPIEFRRLK